MTSPVSQTLQSSKLLWSTFSGRQTETQVKYQCVPTQFMISEPRHYMWKLHNVHKRKQIIQWNTQFLVNFDKHRLICKDFQTLIQILSFAALQTSSNCLLVSWSLMSLFSTNMAISETKGQGWKVIRTQWRKASDILTSTLAASLFSNHPKRKRDQEAHYGRPM